MSSITTLNQGQMAKALNEWMRRFIEEPERYAREFETVNTFLAEEAEGKEPSYGTSGAAYMLSLVNELDNPATEQSLPASPA